MTPDTEVDRRYRKRMDRYWGEMFDRACRSLAGLDMKSWFDYHHIHTDWKSKGNRCPENRRSAVEVACKLLDQASGQIKVSGRETEIQCWAMFSEDTGQDAVYFHSQNPNGSAFPAVFENCRWGVEWIDANDVVDLARYEIGDCGTHAAPIYVVRPNPRTQV